MPDTKPDTSYPGHVKCFVTTIKTDPTQYKPYAPELTPVDALIVDIPLDAEHVVDYDATDGVLEITLQGYLALLQVIADGVSEMHAERLSTKPTDHKFDF